jgi:hypothetical protein
MEEEKIVFSKITGKRRPPCDITCTREPNLELMARAIINLYHQTKNHKLESVKS